MVVVDVVVVVVVVVVGGSVVVVGAVIVADTGSPRKTKPVSHVKVTTCPGTSEVSDLWALDLTGVSGRVVLTQYAEKENN